MRVRTLNKFVPALKKGCYIDLYAPNRLVPRDFQIVRLHNSIPFFCTNMKPLLRLKTSQIIRSFPVGFSFDESEFVIPKGTVGEFQRSPNFTFTHNHLGTLLNCFFVPFIKEKSKGNQLVSKEVTFDSSIEPSRVNKKVFLETGIKAIDFFAPVARAFDVIVAAYDNNGDNDLLNHITFNLNKKKLFISSFNVDKNPLKLYNEYVQNKILFDPMHQNTDVRNPSDCNAVMFYALADDFPARKLFCAKNALRVSERAAKSERGAVFVYQNRNSTLNALNEIRYESNLPPLDLLLRFSGKGQLLTDLDDFDRLSSSKGLTYPELNLGRFQHHSTIFSSLKLPRAVALSLFLSPVAALGANFDALVLVGPDGAVDPIRSTSRLFGTDAISDRHEKLVKVVRKAFVRDDQRSFKTGEKMDTTVQLLRDYLFKQEKNTFVPLEVVLSDCERILGSRFL